MAVGAGHLMLMLLMMMSALVAVTRAAKWTSGSTVDEIMNTCLDGKNHKSKPGPEANLFDHCSPWANRSCCTQETSGGVVGDDPWLNFNWHHCQRLSPRCTDRFKRDLCFYECSPNVGPFLVSDVRKIRNDSYQDVPLCQHACEEWWNDCKADFTCTDNWTRNFKWINGTNQCPSGSTCDTFVNIFGNASNFCEMVWDHGFKVVPDTQDCFVLWFSGNPNPNEAVARRAAETLLATSLSPSSVSPVVSHLVFFVIFVFVFF